MFYWFLGVLRVFFFQSNLSSCILVNDFLSYKYLMQMDLKCSIHPRLLQSTWPQNTVLYSNYLKYLIFLTLSF